MEERTRAYLRGRFRDYYRREDVDPPPDADRREWGYIPWTSSPGTTMVRHRSLLDLGDLSDFVQRERPRHVYFSAGRYEYPGASTMDGKDWIDSDLIFDLDADHLPAVTLGEDSYAEMLAKCKDALLRLLDFLERDFGFEDLTVVFSGGRGYHVHVRDGSVQRLEREHRREIVDYLQSVGFDVETLKRTVTSGAVTRRVLAREGGWGKRTHEAMLEFADDLQAMDPEDALARLQEFQGIGQKGAEAILGVVREDEEALREGNLEKGGPAMRKLVDVMARRVTDEQPPGVDEPVTTDTHRLIRLPGSLHGGSGLAVRRIDRDAIDEFDPLVDAVPETFVGQEVTVEVEADATVQLYDETFTIAQGEHRLPEFAAIFLMARGQASKGKE